MKVIKFSLAVALAAFTFTACNSGETSDEGTDTVVIEKEAPAKTSEEEDEGSSIGFDVNADEDGNVSGGVSGDIDIDEK